MRERWPQIRSIHLFGSVLDDRFRGHSDLDLLADGLPPPALLDAIALAEDAGPLPVDLKRREDLNNHAGLRDLGQRLENSADAVEAAALRLHSLYTGVERMLLLINHVVNGGTPSQGEGWDRLLLERMAMATDTRPAVLNESKQQELQEFLRFRQLVRNLYTDELRLEPSKHLIEQLQSTWPKLETDITGFKTWLRSIASEST